ncbi:hypothetical protein CQW23_29830 [Capsicum baccatum]|uniref:Uncharacterized protein n=1 Tax=Capsicum baccatum TaxID=33114 RepID=A0A2G2VC05_CAPBA|nr:hypothetical protein CQW23_29830 [Capsicum baccatum]
MGRDHLGGVILGLLTFEGIEISRKILLSKMEEERLLSKTFSYLRRLSYSSISLQRLGSGMMAEDNSNELAGLVTNVKNDSMAEDNTDEIVSPVTSMKNDSMDEDNIDELVSLVTSVKNDSAGSKPDKMSTIKLRSMSNGNKVLPYSSSTSSYNAGNTRRQSTGNLNAPDSGQDVIPHYIRSFTGSFHDFCNYGRKHSSEAKPWHPLSKERTNFLLMSGVLHGPWEYAGIGEEEDRGHAKDFHYFKE